MKWFVRIIALISLGGGNGQFIILQGTRSGNILGELYHQLPMGLNDTIFEGKLKHLSVRRGKSIT